MRKIHTIMTALKTFLAERRLTLREFAGEVGKPISTVHGWVTGRRKPQWTDIPAIERATGGKVTARDFVPQQAA